MACLHLARSRDEVGVANPASLKNGIHGGQSLDLGSSIGPEVVTNGNIPGRRPSAEPLVQHDGRGAAIGEADIEVAAVRHILLMQGYVDAALLPQQFDDRFLIDRVAPIVANLPGISAQVVGTALVQIAMYGCPRSRKMVLNRLVA